MHSSYNSVVNMRKSVWLCLVCAAIGLVSLVTKIDIHMHFPTEFTLVIALGHSFRKLETH